MKLEPKIITWIQEVALWILAVLFGAGTRLAWRSRVKKLTSGYILGVIIMACFAGFITDKACTYYNVIQLRGAFVAIAALLSEGLIGWLFANDSKIWSDIFQLLLSKAGKPKNENDNNA